MNFTRRRGAIATAITVGVLLIALTIFLNIQWIILSKTHIVYLVLGVIIFAIIVAGLVLNTIFLVREVRRNERQDSFLNAVTHELKTPIASIWIRSKNGISIRSSARSSTASCTPTPTVSSPPSSRC
jgi:signal transduction histidine kinase